MEGLMFPKPTREKKQRKPLRAKTGIRTKGKTVKAKKPANKKLPSIAKEKAKAREVFNKYIRLRDGKCITCGSTENLQASHFHGEKARPAVRFDEMNVHAQCSKCHYLHHHGREADYAMAMLGRYTILELEELQRRSRMPSKMTRDDIKIVRDLYTMNVKILEATE